MIQFVLKYNKYTEGDFLQYTGYKNIPDFYDRVRALLSADSVSLSDEIVDFPENAPLAEKMIKRRVIDWEVLPEEKIPILNTAVIYQTAIIARPLSKANEYKIAQTQSLKIEYAETDISLLNVLSNRLDEILSELEDVATVNAAVVFEIS